MLITLLNYFNNQKLPLDNKINTYYIQFINYLLFTFNYFINWEYISNKISLNENIVNITKQYLNWDLISEKRIIPYIIIQKYQDYINFNLLIYNNPYYNIYDIYKTLHSYLDWNMLSLRYYNNLEFSRDFKDYINWRWVSIHDLSLDYIREFKDYLHWDIMIIKDLDYDFINDFSDKINWKLIAKQNNLPKEFIHKYIIELSEPDILSSDEELEDINYLRNSIAVIKIQRWYRYIINKKYEKYNDYIYTNELLYLIFLISLISYLIKFLYDNQPSTNTY